MDLFDVEISRIFDVLKEMESNGSIYTFYLMEFRRIVFEQIFFITLFIISIISVGAVLVIVRFWRRKYAVREASSGNTKARFRKRDKVLFYGRKMLRKVRSISAGASKKKKMISKLTRKLLQMKKESLPTTLQVLEPPAEYLQEDVSTLSDQRLPPEVTYMLQSIRMFGIFERPLFLELCKHMQTTHVAAGEFLFQIGESDENFYVVQSGMLNVFITECDGSTISLKVVKEGESIASLLSFTDVLTGHTQPFKTVSAQALDDSVVLKLPVSAFREVFEQYPETFVRVIQIIMVRLHRVTFTALHQHLGLSAELVATTGRKKSIFSNFNSARATNGKKDDYRTSRFTPETERLKKRHSAPIPIIGSQHSDPGFYMGSSSSHRSQLLYSERGIFAGGSSYDPGDFADDFMDEKTEEFESSDETLTRAVEAFKTNLGLEDEELIKDVIHIRDVPKGAYLVKEDSSHDCGLVYVVSGLLSLSQHENDRDIHMYVAAKGEFVGALAVLTGEPSVFTIRARLNTRIATMSSSNFYNIIAQKPKAVLHVAHLVVKRLSPFVRQIDFAMDWLFLESGRALYKQNCESDCTYILLSGRLRSVITRADGKKQLVGEYGRGDLVGIVETLTCNPRSTTVMAVRDTELAKLPEGLLNAIKLKYPIVVSRLINLLGHRILGSWQQPTVGPSSAAAIDSKPAHVNFSTVAVISVTDDVPLSAFTFELIHSLSSIGSALRLTSDYVKRTLGNNIMESPNEFRLNSWLAQQEDKHRIVIYQCDQTMTLWTQICIRQADCILIVCIGDKEPTIGKVEKQLEHLSIRTQKELVLLHKEGGERPKNTAAWLNARSWCSSHHHLQCPKRVFSKKAMRSDYYSSILFGTEANVHSDFSRLARWLTGTSVGLVLGGGGARGAAHVGMIKAIQEAGIPIDMVGGVSIGAFMGALWCSERNVTTMTQKAREWARKTTQWWRHIVDLTYPVTSMFTGAVFNQSIKDTFADVQIEDLWLPYFTITTDISASTMRMHTHGSLWRYVRASMSLSGYMPPLCDPTDSHLLLDGGYVNNLPGILWRYIRASMTIAGILPPMPDEDNHLLIDGCYVNNVPADVMRGRGARYILAVDVGSQDDTDLTNYGDSLSGWWLLWVRWTSHFRSIPVKVPNLPDIQSRLAYVSCVRQLEEVRNSDYCHYVRPPIDKYKTLQFGSFDEIKDVGYNHGKTYFDGMMKGGSILNVITGGNLGGRFYANTERDGNEYSY